MRLALPVYHPARPGTVLIRAGLPLESVALQRLKELRVPELYIRCPKLAEIERMRSPRVEAARAEVTGAIANAFDAATRRFDPELDFGTFRAVITSLITRLTEQERAAMFVSELACVGAPALRHATDVAVLATLIGLRIDFYLLRERPKKQAAQAKDVTSLGMAAMLHDIGMMRLDEGTLHRWNTTRDEEDERWQEHVQIGYKMLQGRVDPTVSAAVLHHHQRFDGTGFPRSRVDGYAPVAPSGSGIHVFARIIAAADMFDRLVHPASDPGSEDYELEARPAVRALRILQREDVACKLDPVVLWGLLNVCPAYPPGTIVRLSDGTRAVVAAWDPAHPCRPKVVRICEGAIEDVLRDDPDGKPEYFRLSEIEDLTIVECDGHDVSSDNYDLTEIGVPDEVPLDDEAKAA